jgi:hypothetical protein
LDTIGVIVQAVTNGVGRLSCKIGRQQKAGEPVQEFIENTRHRRDAIIALRACRSDGQAIGTAVSDQKACGDSPAA